MIIAKLFRLNTLRVETYKAEINVMNDLLLSGRCAILDVIKDRILCVRHLIRSLFL